MIYGKIIKMILKKKLLIKLIRIFISLLILSLIIFFLKEFVSHKIKMPYNYNRVIK